MTTSAATAQPSKGASDNLETGDDRVVSSSCYRLSFV